jgi:riboflavin biosynthesis pyrimidine reductase
VGERGDDRTPRRRIDARQREQAGDRAAHPAEVGDPLIELGELGRAGGRDVAPADRALLAAGMEAMEKLVFSRTLREPGWKNARIVNGDLVNEVRKLKQGTGSPMLIMGSGSIVSQLTKERLIDSYTMVIWPIVLGAGRTMFEGVEGIVDLTKVDEKTFANGNIVATYELG